MKMKANVTGIRLEIVIIISLLVFINSRSIMNKTGDSTTIFSIHGHSLRLEADHLIFCRIDATRNTKGRFLYWHKILKIAFYSELLRIVYDHHFAVFSQNFHMWRTQVYKVAVALAFEGNNVSTPIYLHLLRFSEHLLLFDQFLVHLIGVAILIIFQ